jgi:hypothetical protein
VNAVTIQHLEDHILERIGEDAKVATLAEKMDFVKAMSTALLSSPYGEDYRTLLTEYCMNESIYSKLGLNPDDKHFHTDARYCATVAWTTYTKQRDQARTLVLPPLAA